MKKGDPDRGSLLILVSSRGRHVACLERVLNLDGSYQWQAAGPGDSAGSAEIADFLARRARFDEDMWAWNWISRTLNGSSLKRPLWVDPARTSVKTRNNNKSGGHSLGPNSENATRDGESRQAQAEVFASKTRMFFVRFTAQLWFHSWFLFVPRC